jgi:folylpolyglutamate synthase/dihydropteroate synthase
MREIAPQANIELEPDCRKALLRAIEAAGPKGVATVAGSLYLVGDMKETIRTEREEGVSDGF